MQPGLVAYSNNPSTWKVKKEAGEMKISRSSSTTCMVSSRTTWAI